MFGLGLTEIIIIFAIIVLIFGARKLPDIMGSFGKAIKNFKKEIREADGEAPSPDTSITDNSKKSEKD